jgi:hypothetical protein
VGEHVAVGAPALFAGRAAEFIRADALVDVIIALDVAHVDGDAILVVDDDLRALVLDAAERRTLDRRAGRVERIDLDTPAEGVGLERIEVGVEALVDYMPLVTRAGGADCVARLAREVTVNAASGRRLARRARVCRKIAPAVDNPVVLGEFTAGPHDAKE